MAENLPQPKKGAEKIAGLAIALATDVFAFTSGLPISSVLFATFHTLLEKRKERSQEILFEEIKSGNIDLEFEGVDYFVPNSLKYFQMARDGESEETLEILARLIASGLDADVENILTDNEYKRQAEAVSNLNKKDFQLLEILRTDHIELKIDPDLIGSIATLRGALNIHKDKLEKVFDTKYDLKEAISRLIGRGLLIFDPISGYGGGWVDYEVTPLYVRIRKRAFDKIQTMAQADASN